VPVNVSFSPPRHRSEPWVFEFALPRRGHLVEGLVREALDRNVVSLVPSKENSTMRSFGIGVVVGPALLSPLVELVVGVL